ncbi:MAG TPA: hypothetical protein VIC06_00920 [Solirubrobacteraceae bacterium]|jgi:hypothetical protein
MDSLPDVVGTGGKLPVDRQLSRHRDELVLRWLCDQYAGRLDHLEVLTGKNTLRVREIVARLCEAGWVYTRRILVGEPMWVFPTQQGLKRCCLTVRELIPSSARLTHMAAINDVRLHIQLNSPDTHWISERTILIEGPPRRQSYIPDGVAIHDGHKVAIEVELHAKRVGVVRRKLTEHEQRYDAVLYFCASGPHRQLTKLAETGRWPNLGVRELPNPIRERR